MSVNVNRDVDDPFYRYKMPKIQSKIEGKGNGIKTVIPNMVEVSKAIGRPPEYPTKYFGCELGSQTIMDTKNARYIVNGAHEANKLADVLDGFIKKFVLCSSCGNPETVMIFKGRSQDIYLSCKACGKVNIADNTHRICNYIRNNPPPTTEIKNQATNNSKMKTEPISVPSKESLNEEAKQTNKPQEDNSEKFAEFVGELNHTAAEIALEASKFDIDDERAGLIVIQVLLGESILTSFAKHKLLLADLAKNSKIQKGFIGGIERIVGFSKPELLPKLKSILKGFYDNDILSEEVINQWHEKPTKKYTGDKDLATQVRAEASQFVEWLKNAEEESEEED